MCSTVIPKTGNRKCKGPEVREYAQFKGTSKKPGHKENSRREAQRGKGEGWEIELM